ncbi:TPA: hypothetical protein DHW62_01380 [candidate division WWE3 bacterium]|uniref:Uncharacterized protein n=1 Tax=candidate division WWE3 bacterium TaxID=2053526 RepID=A0A656PPN3_UNCKA|nr:hypothetical protein P147_WWE3C00001G0909 [candidate division WWE3 bacterium RAAC2_WWE3_1]KKS29480.1 MAG: hypothetical protein UU91_C0005G0012 [candidate division WWE3 bacterium GW2011_GWB1_42_117]KKS54913.1 MAG: hypothetical protein UV21_C0004G0078 [candidate division WWE3 bacterium GW2011_GWD2_42_34]KKT05529.1 MAG: hypothetical protein UV83_C0003G0084 [candidate division WWE3 bacterium GW2011_GWE2_43_18]KKT06717.1 MAG: hypothetical protein UV84_C0004G0005 [candidate division WWE3 bacterium
MEGTTETIQPIQKNESFFDTHQNPLDLKELRKAYKELAEETGNVEIPDDEIIKRAAENKLTLLYPMGYRPNLFDKEIARMRTQLEIAHKNREEEKRKKEEEISTPEPPAPSTGYTPKRPVTNWMQEWENNRS